MSKGKVLVVDDERNAREGLTQLLVEDGHEARPARDGFEALKVIEEWLPDVVVADLKMPGMDGIELLRRAREMDPDVRFIMMTAYGTVDSAVQAMKDGADDYLLKPIDIDELEVHMEKAIERRRLLVETRMLKERLREPSRFQHMVGNSPPMQALFKVIEQVAPSRATVLILGESGTGKELVAQAIHQRSPRRDGPFVPVSCAGLAETVLESELFGHEKGAFTGAIGRRKGRFEVADGGTLFLDEVGEVDPATQVKLLRFLQEREFERVGGNQTIKVDVRLLAASNRDLEQAVKEGHFREDLFYRLNVVVIRVPPLRERKSDIPALVDHFIRTYAQENAKAVQEIESDALARLMSYDWPGNVRELANVIERAVVLSTTEVISGEDLPEALRQDPGDRKGPSFFVPGTPLREIEKEAILRTLAHVGGNRTQAADLLGISVRNLQYKLKEYSENA